MVHHRIVRGIAAALLSLPLVVDVDVASAQEKPAAASIAVIDVQFLMQNLDAAKSARARIEKMRADYQAEVKAKHDELTRLGQTIMEERGKISAEAYQQRTRDLRQKVDESEREVQERQAKFTDALRGISQLIAAAIDATADEITKERRLTLVLLRSAVVGTPSVPDITPEILQRLNQRMPAVTIDIPK